MKRIYFLLALLCPVFCAAQDFTYEDLTHDTLQTVDEVLEHLDLTQVPSGLVLDKSFPWINVTQYNGNHLTDDNLMDFDTFGYAYATLYGASVDNNSIPPHPSRYMIAPNG